MAYAQTKQHAHELLERMAPGQVFAIVTVMESMLDPVSRAIANAPMDDEQETDVERKAVAASKASMAGNSSAGIAFDEVLSELGVTLEDLRTHPDAA
jgi:hypothetical protein